MYAVAQKLSNTSLEAPLDNVAKIHLFRLPAYEARAYMGNARYQSAYSFRYTRTLRITLKPADSYNAKASLR